MAQPLLPTNQVFDRDDKVRKLEMLKIPNVIADFHFNHNTEVLLTSIIDMWEEVVGVLRLEGLHKTYRLISEGRPAVGQLNVIGPESIVEGETFTLNDGVNGPAVFEFDTNASVLPGNIAVDISTASSFDDVRDAVITAINGAGAGVCDITASPEAIDGIGTPFGNRVFLENNATPTGLTAFDQNVQITDTVADERFTHVGMKEAHSINAVGYLGFGAPGDLTDGDTFTVEGGTAQETTFEFDTNASIGAGNIQVDISAAADEFDVRTAVLGAVNGQTGSTGIAATTADRFATGQIAVIRPDLYAEGETFSIDDGATTETFEFDTDASVGAGNVAVDISAAVTVKDAREAIIAAINGSALTIDASNIGFGNLVDLVHQVAGRIGNTTSVSNVANTNFTVSNMEGGTAGVSLFQSTKVGTLGNTLITTTTISLTFIEGMSGGIDAGWDVTRGHAAFQGYNIFIEDVPRLPAVVGSQNFLKIRVTESNVNVTNNPEIIQFDIPGLAGGPFNGMNQIRWDYELVIESGSVTTPLPTGDQVKLTDGVLARLKALNFIGCSL